MNPFLLGLLAMLLRQGILILAGALGIGPLVQQYVAANMSEFTQVSLGLAAGLIALLYAAWKNFTSRQKLVQALHAASLTEHTIEAMVKDKNIATPSVTAPKSEVPT